MDKMDRLNDYLLNHQDICVVKVRFNDTDAMGIVHFMNYMMYFDDGFVSFMNSLKTSRRIEEMIHENLALGVKHVEITYEGSAKFGDYIMVETRIEKLGEKSITFQHTLRNKSDKTLLAEVKAVRFIMNLKTEKLMNVHEFFLYFLNK